jgi:hypothetical protein
VKLLEHVVRAAVLPEPRRNDQVVGSGRPAEHRRPPRQPPFGEQACETVCTGTSRGTLGLCGPCRQDAECADGEICILDHCLLSRNAKCRSRRECAGEEALCILSGYSADPRGNAALTAECRGPRGGQAQPEDWRPPAGLGAPAPPVRSVELMESVRRIARGPMAPRQRPWTDCLDVRSSVELSAWFELAGRPSRR